MIALVSLMACSLLTGATVEQNIPWYECLKTTSPPTIDGQLTDAAWADVPEIPHFYESCSGKVAKYLTTARLCWDNNNLYIAFRSEDPCIWGTLTKRDSAIFNEEVVEVFLQPDPKDSIYYEFEVSPRNVKFDSLIRSVTPENRYSGNSKWTCKGLKTAVFVEGTAAEKSESDRFWQVEIAIPFKGLKRTPPKTEEVWRANLYRIERNDNLTEFQAWSPTLTPRPNFHVPARFGRLIFKDLDRASDAN
ncbi:MAG TPA: carbohydrate-binding family 9-like protein [bacterium]|nr:carbohydrate-binding family 9-like protein [bacterium]